MDGWIRKIIVTLAALVLIAWLVRLVFALIGPLVPALIGLLVAFLILRLVLHRPKSW